MSDWNVKATKGEMSAGARKLRDQSETEGRIGEGKNAGVRNVANGTQRFETGYKGRSAAQRDPDLRVGAKGVMHQDIGESICLQSGNECEEAKGL